jgi:opacity protein-like surface antigen
MPHIGVGIGAMNVFDGLKIPSRALVFNDSSWQFAYQAIGGLRYDTNPVLTFDLDYPIWRRPNPHSGFPIRSSTTALAPTRTISWRA